ncbi:MAG: BglG family transcription antiterminator [Symbiobacteriia bacterium]
MTGARRREIILSALKGAQRPMTIGQLASLARSSARSVRYDLDELDERLAPQGVRLVRKPRLGIWLEGSAANLELVRPQEPEPAAPDSFLPQHERLALGLTRLLVAADGVAVADLSDLLGVTPATVRRELERMAAWLQVRSLSLQRSRAGAAVTGSEVARRWALYELLREWVLEADLGPNRGWRRSVGERVLGEVGLLDVPTLRSTVEEAAASAAYPLTPGQGVGLLFWSAIVLARRGAGVELQLPEHVADSARDLPENPLARQLLVRLGLPDGAAEVAFLALQVRGVRYGPAELRKLDMEVTRHRAREAALVFARQAGQLLGVAVEADEDLIRGLILHLEPALDRVAMGLVAPNPLLGDIKLRYAALYAVSKQAAAAIEPPIGVLADEEIGYLTVHLGAAIERLARVEDDQIRAILVCEHGVGTAQLLASLLTGRLPELTVCGYASSYGVDQEAARCGADVVITTRPVTSARLPVFLVHPIPDVIELAALRARLQAVRRAPRPEPLATRNSANGGASPLMLEHVLTEDTVALNVPAAGWQEAIRAAGNLLVHTGAVTPDYIDGMIRTVLTIGPYVVVGPGIAMPHTRPEDGALRVGLSCVRLAEPVVFLNKTENPVDLVFAFAGIDNQSHLTVMGQLARILSEPELVERIRQAGTVADVLAVVHSVPAT